MKKTYTSKYGKIVKMCPGTYEYWYYGKLIARGSGLSSPNPECPPTRKDWEICITYLDSYNRLTK